MVFFYWLVCIREAGSSRTKLTALAGLMVSNGRHITIGRIGKYCTQSSPTSALSRKDQDLRPCFSPPQLRQGRSLWLPTLPNQRTNRYAVDGVLSVFVLFRSRICHTNHPVVASVMPMFILLHPRIFHTNRHEVVSAIPAFVLLHLHISHTNRYEVVGTTPLICA